MIKKKFCLVSFLLISHWYGIYSMEEKRCYVYFHGYGEPVLNNEQNFKVKFEEDQTQQGLFPDITKSSFYTKLNVITGLQFLKKKVVEEQYNALDITARSNGGGVFINCLYFLHHYEQHQDYFKDSEISEQNAKAILDAINKGSIIITVPFLSLYNALILVRLSTIGGYSTAAVLTYFGYKKYGYKFNVIFLLPIFYLINQLSRLSSQGASVEEIVPRITHYSYDPNHINPIEAVKYLQNKIKCPVLLHCCKNDGVLKGPNQDTVTLFENLRTGNEDTTYIILTGDDSHNREGITFKNIKILFSAINDNEKGKIENSITDLGGIKDVPSLKKEIGLPVLSLFDLTFKKSF